MKLAVAVAVVLPSIALAAGPKPPPVLATATATSAQPKSPAWGVIENVADSRGWCPAKGNGVGESVTVTFDRAIPITSLTLYTGTVDELQVTAGAQSVTTKNMNVPLDGSAVSSLTFTIKSVQRGKTKTCFTGFRAVSPSTWFYTFLYGVDAAAVKALPEAVEKLDAA